jgi:uncharacterized metal-binding protein YceD (DUF177 family)
MKTYNIPYTGLKLGRHTFEFDLIPAFFEEFDYNEITSSNIHVDIVLEKSEMMIVANMEAHGTVEVTCNRCNDPFDMEIEAATSIVFKYTDEEIDDDTIIGVLPSEHELKMANPMFQMIALSLPLSFNHEYEEDCNEEMIRLLDGYRYIEELGKEEEEEEIDPRWEALKNLNKDKNK